MRHSFNRIDSGFLALTERAQCYIAKEQYDRARSDLDRLLSIDSENAEVQVNIPDHH